MSNFLFLILTRKPTKTQNKVAEEMKRDRGEGRVKTYTDKGEVGVIYLSQDKVSTLKFVAYRRSWSACFPCFQS